MIAILPAAGKGTRMQELTQGGAKELLPVGDKPVIGWALLEASEAQPSRVVVISSPEKPDMNAYLAANQQVKVEMQFVQDGLAPAIALAGGQDSAIVILPDTLYYPNKACSRIVRALTEGFDIVLLTEQVPDEHVSKYGIVESNSSGEVHRILEKPSPSSTQSRQAVAGRYGFSEKMMQFLVETVLSLGEQDKEIGITPILNLALKNGYSAISVPTLSVEKRYDCGSLDGYRKAIEAVK